MREIDNFLMNELVKHSEAGFAMILRKLLEIWGLVEKEQILEYEEVEDYGIFEI